MKLANFAIVEGPVAGPCKEFPGGYGRRWRTEEALPIIELLTEHRDFFSARLNEVGVIGVVNSVPGESPRKPAYPSNFLPLHSDPVDFLAFQTSDRQKPRSFPFQTAPTSVAASAIREMTSKWLKKPELDLYFRHWLEGVEPSTGDDQFVTSVDRVYARSADPKFRRTLRSFLREAHALSGPHYDHSFFEFPDSTLIVKSGFDSKRRFVEHGRFVPEDMHNQDDIGYLHLWIF